MSTKSAYHELCERLEEIQHISGALSILGWDLRTYMPKGAIDKRSRELSTLSRIAHEKFVDPTIGHLLAQAAQEEANDPIKQRNIFLWQRDYNQEIRLPTEFVANFSKQTSITESLWEQAKAKSDFKLVQPEFEKLVGMIKQKAHYLNPDKAPYDVLLDLFEPGLTMKLVNQWFDPLKAGVKSLITRCLDAPNQPDPAWIKVPAPVDNQKRVSKWIMDFLHMDPLRSRIDESEHPCTVGTLMDERITTHCLDNDPFASVYAVFH